jgi:hypothetical protein
MAGYYSVCSCGSVDCPGECGPEEPVDAELESLAETPQGLGLEPVDLAWELWQTEEDARAKAAAELAWDRRRVA